MHSCCLYVSQVVVDEAYKIIARTYVEHLITNKRRTLKGRWAPNIGEQIHEDANHLHKSISLLVRSTSCKQSAYCYVNDVLPKEQLEIFFNLDMNSCHTFL